MRPPPSLIVLALLGLAAPAHTRAKPLGAQEILVKAENVRNPDLEYAVDFTIHGVSRGDAVVERDASYGMIASGKDRSVILMRSPDMLYGALVLMAEGRSFMLLPKASKAWELSAAQMVNGDVASGDLARSNLTRGYAATVAGEDDLDGVRCWRLELQSENTAMHYPRIVYWVAQSGFLPRQLDHYGRSGKLLKTVRYGDYRKGALGLRSMQLTIESFSEWKEGCTLTFTNLRKLKSGPEPFTPEGMIRLRDAALAAREATGGVDAPFERILRTAAADKPTDSKR